MRRSLPMGMDPCRGAWVRAMPEREKRFGLTRMGVTDEVREAGTSQMDHAGRNETSLVLYYRPELVDLQRLDADRDIWPQGAGGEYGRECMENAVALVGQLMAASGV